MSTNPSREPGLSIRPDVTRLSGILRADQIRHDTLVVLVAGWGDDDTREDVIAQLDTLAEAVTSPREGELDHLVEAVEAAASMDDAEVALDWARLLRLRDELNAVISSTLGRFARKGAPSVLLAKMPRQRRAS
ncbi:hypothetical protein [Streptomyces sp. NPDC051577]|uniref:hypothetical protein n=1 Tax=Streptomyces sp. NPDC051577 TaxID=3155166 RepID=UPI0034146125